MARSKTPGQPAWLTMGEAMAAVRQTGKLPEVAAAILFAALARGTLIGRADHVRMESTDGVTEYHDHVVPAGVLDLGPMPPLGHPFWSRGDVRVCPPPRPDGSEVRMGGETIVLPLGGLLPVYTIRGLRVPQEALDALCRSLAALTRIGRRKGIGGFASEDEPLIREMHELRDRTGRDLGTRSSGGGCPEGTGAKPLRVKGAASGRSIPRSIPRFSLTSVFLQRLHRRGCGGP